MAHQSPPERMVSSMRWCTHSLELEDVSVTCLGCGVCFNLNSGRRWAGLSLEFSRNYGRDTNQGIILKAEAHFVETHGGLVKPECVTLPLKIHQDSNHLMGRVIFSPLCLQRHANTIGSFIKPSLLLWADLSSCPPTAATNIHRVCYAQEDSLCSDPGGYSLRGNPSLVLMHV